MPDLVAIHRARPDSWPYLLASSSRGGELARWSMLLFAAGPVLCLDQAGLSGPGTGDSFLARLRQLTSAPADSKTNSDLPFAGGWFLYLGYELVAEIEPTLTLPRAADGLPVALAARCPAAILIDHVKQQGWLVAECEQTLAAARASLPDPRHTRVDDKPAMSLQLQAEAGTAFMAGVERIRQWILDGDVFQVNLSRGWVGEATVDLDPALLHELLSRSNPAPFAGLARLPGGTVLSSSPERLVEVRGRRVQTRPIAGTRPRGLSADQDAGLSRELIAHPKERAEHIMLIDLERNDLGRVCQTGTVEVDELMVIESYAHVHHIVSNVRGLLRDGVHAADVIAAVFPGGTITGCPKVRCMEIIAELEQHGRGFYTGAMGYLGNDGSMDLNILIRSMVVAGSRLSFRTGAGIVADSEPAAELAETEAKARGLLRALAP
ncbi:MAG: aminodeoxychorismate synthase component I [Wenzhouxiangella sp.]|nr:MAG: aminodeoxychorismate synthase component I [Wenzhouxiangella sp.]